MTTADDQRDSATVRIFPPAIPLITVLAGLGLDYLWPASAEFVPVLPLHGWIGGLLVAGSFFGLGLWSVLLVRRTGQTENPWKPTTEIVDRGPFSVTRNPMYLQMVLICVGFAIGFWNIWILLLTPLCAWALQRFAIEPEEAYLESKFGERYLDYKRRVRRWV